MMSWSQLHGELFFTVQKVIGWQKMRVDLWNLLHWEQNLTGVPSVQNLPEVVRYSTAPTIIARCIMCNANATYHSKVVGRLLQLHSHPFKNIPRDAWNDALSPINENTTSLGIAFSYVGSRNNAKQFQHKENDQPSCRNLLAPDVWKYCVSWIWRMCVDFTSEDRRQQGHGRACH